MLANRSISKLISRSLFFKAGNFWLKDFRRTDLIFRLFRYIPKILRTQLIESYVKQAKENAIDRTVPERMTIFITNQCDMKCSHCFIVKEVQPEIRAMELGEYQKLFRSVRGRVSQILITGGEPILRNDFTDIVVMAYVEGKISTANIFSNGLKNTKLIECMENILQRCAIKLNFQTSIDGTESFHDFNRRVPGAFQSVLESVKMVHNLSQKYPGRIGRTITATAISKQNFDSLAEICEVVTNTGAAPSFGFVRTSGDVFDLKDDYYKNEAMEPEAKKSDGSVKFSDKDYMQLEDMDKALNIINNKVWTKDLGRLSYNYNRVTMKAVRDIKATGESPLTEECRMGYDDLIIFADGTVSRCEMLKPSANLRDYDFNLQDLLASESWRNYLTETAGCWCTHDCGIGVSMMKEEGLLKQLSSK